MEFFLIDAIGTKTEEIDYELIIKLSVWKKEVEIGDEPCLIYQAQITG